MPIRATSARRGQRRELVEREEQLLKDRVLLMRTERAPARRGVEGARRGEPQPVMQDEKGNRPHPVDGGRQGELRVGNPAPLREGTGLDDPLIQQVILPNCSLGAELAGLLLEAGRSGIEFQLSRIIDSGPRIVTMKSRKWPFTRSCRLHHAARRGSRSKFI